MTEQTVSRSNSYAIGKWTAALRVVDIVLLIALVMVEAFGFSALPVYKQAGQEQLTQWIVLMAAFGAPLLIVVIVLWRLIRRLSTEYDYELDDGSFSVYRVAGGRRKLCLTFEMSSVKELRRLADMADDERREALRGCFPAYCNEGSEALVACEAGRCTEKGRSGRRVVILEPNEAMSKAMERALGSRY